MHNSAVFNGSEILFGSYQKLLLLFWLFCKNPKRSIPGYRTGLYNISSFDLIIR